MQAVDKAFVQDICAALRPVQLDEGILDQVYSDPVIEPAPRCSFSPQSLIGHLLQVIAEHLYQQGNFTVGDTFVQEAGIGNAAALKKPYTAMHAVLEQVSCLPSHTPVSAS